MRFMIYDLKRMFSGKALVLMCLLSPIIVVLVFSTIIVPMIFTAKGLHFNLAICDEDKGREVNQFITQMVNSKSLADMVSVYPVSTVDDGLELVEGGDVSVLVYIPQNFFADMQKGTEVKVSIISTKAHSLEATLISMTMDSSLSIVGQGQNVMEAAKYMLIEKGESQASANEYFDASMNSAINEYMNRREVLGEGGPLSLTGEYLPVEYYLAAIFSLFAALSMLPLIHFSSVDVMGAILRRGLLCGIGTIRFFLARIISGTIFIVLVQMMLFPTAALLHLAGDNLGGLYANNLLALVLAILLSSICYASLSLAIATWLPNEKTALWMGFYLVLCMAVVCGALLPESALPKWASDIGKWLPMRASMRTLSLSLFDYDQEIFWKDILKTVGFTAILLSLGFLGLKRKGRSA